MTSTTDTLLASAVAAHQQGRLQDAERQYQAVLAIDSVHAPALGLLGALMLQRNDPVAALPLLEKALRLDPRQPSTLNNHGHALNLLKRYDDALRSLDAALALQPEYAAAHNNRGTALRGLKRYEEARASFESALIFNPTFVEALNNRANSFLDFDQIDAAVSAYTKVIIQDPNFSLGHFNRAKALSDLGRYDEAMADYDRALELNPNDADAQFAKGMLKLLKGDFIAGWELYESRWASRNHTEGARSLSQPLWRGNESIQGKTILIHAEQGFGDTLQFCRFIPNVQALGADVKFIVQPELASLLAPALEGCELLTSFRNLPSFDVHCPLMSLPFALKLTLETLPSASPYIVAKPDKANTWAQRLGAWRRPRIGIAWSGRTTHKNDKNRSIALDQLRGIFGMTADFHVLQNHVSDSDYALLKTLENVSTHAKLLRDFSETAAMVAAMDLVISVDTSLAHLAGAMAKPLWVLLPFAPDFRWLLNRDDSPWYPTARLYRQSQRGKWDDVISRVAKDLEAETRQLMP